MSELLTTNQMKFIENQAIQNGQITGLQLMENAGLAVVNVIFDEWPELKKKFANAIILCGPGNNGGDGFVISRLLKEKGWAVQVFFYGSITKLPKDAKVTYKRWLQMGSVKSLSFRKTLKWSQFRNYDIVVDALFGTGLTRAVELPLEMPKSSSGRTRNFRLVSVDIASGLCADSGRILSDKHGNINAIGPADLTVTFHRPKVGHVLADGPRMSKRLKVVDIGISSDKKGVLQQANTTFSIAGNSKWFQSYYSQEHGVSEVLDKFNPCNVRHKYQHGHAIVVAGPLKSSGAVRLAARGALRVGAGLVSVVCDNATLFAHALHLNAIMTKVANNDDDFETLLEDQRMNAICLGPGLGIQKAQNWVPVALKSHRAVVLDADALTAFSKNPSELFDMLHDRCILTPHEGEFKRLFPDIANKLILAIEQGPVFSKRDAVIEAAARANCTILLKGADTVIGHSDGRTVINSASYDPAAHWLATAGSGDVLSGFIVGLLARGFTPMDAARISAWLHVECACLFGPGLIAEDIPEQIPKILSTLDHYTNTLP
ncbi:MAG: NAD(P)H-hydrate dehydratase [Aestuariivita sp.]|nr:NAD(P)H-hydrate dehydratase [Aestuariivita sp.]